MVVKYCLIVSRSGPINGTMSYEKPILYYSDADLLSLVFF